ncbi:MAG: DUF192 domain-containing protein [bacterium]
MSQHKNKHHENHKEFKYYWYVIGVCSLGAVLFCYEMYVNSSPLLTSSAVEQKNVVSQPLSLIVVRTQAAKEHGLGGRSSLPVDTGMLFVFDRAANYGIWMKDMLFSIDIISLDADFTVSHVESNVATSTYPAIFYSPSSTKYIIETNAGYARKNNVKVGDVLDFAKKAVQNP